MFHIEPYTAERQVFISSKDGGMTSTWEPCQVLGVSRDADGELVYIVEHYSGREHVLSEEAYVRVRH